MTPVAYRITNLSKKFDRRAVPANDNLTFEVRSGEIFGILGANGAGKSTLVRQMVNLLKPSSGSIELFGEELNFQSTLAVGYMPQDADALNRLQVEEALYYSAHFRGLSRADAQADASALMKRWGLEIHRTHDNFTLSGGQRRLLRLAVAMAGRPAVLILDEPTSDLDPVRRRLVWDVLGELRTTSGTTIIFITHDAVEAEKVVDRVAILVEGRLVALGTPAALKQVVGREVRIDLSTNARTIPWPESSAPRMITSGRWVLEVPWPDAIAFLQRLDPAAVEDIRITTPSLEDAFIHHATGATPTVAAGAVR